MLEGILKVEGPFLQMFLQTLLFILESWAFHMTWPICLLGLVGQITGVYEGL